MSYKPLGEYGLIGDMRTAALVSRDGSIDWSCFPRFDSPSVFARILDDRRGGFWSIAPTGRFQSSHEYEAGTNVLVTRFDSGSGELLLTDFMPALEWNEQLASHHEIHRRPPGPHRGVGSPPFRVSSDPSTHSLPSPCG